MRGKVLCAAVLATGLILAGGCGSEGPSETIQAVYAHNDDMALGAIQALEAAGMNPGKDVLLISIDAVPDGLQAMTKGTLNATVECNPLLGPAAFDAVAKVLKGESLPKKLVVKDRLFDQSTPADVIEAKKASFAAGETAPAAGTPAAEALTVGFSQIGAESAWRTAETKSVCDEAAKRGIDLKFSDAQQKQENQIKAIRSFIAQKVQAIVLAPVVETGWEPVLREAQRAKIPVVLVDRGVKVSDESLYATLIASDFIEEGRMAGEWLAKKMNGKGNIVQLEGTPGSAPAIDRKKGFEEAIAKYPGMKVIKSQSGDFTRAKGKEVMEAFIKAQGRTN